MSADDLVRQLAQRETEAAAKAWEQGYRHALTNAGDEAVEADRRRYSLANDVADLERRLGEALADRDAERREGERLRREVEQAHQDLQNARDHAAECMRETAQLHRQLDSLGTNPDRLAEQVGAGQAVELFGHVYVARELLELGEPGPALEPGTYASTELEEAGSGVFVPIPKGHMLSVTVTPYEDQPAD